MHWLVKPQRQASLLPQRQKSESNQLRRSKMATPKVSSHTRSTSLPSASHPLNGSTENLLRRLSASQAERSSSSAICQNLFNLKDMYVHLNDLIHLPHNHNILTHGPHRGEVEEVLDGSLSLIDISSVAMDALSHMKESILDLQSALRRGSEDDGIHAYLMSRKKICKTISKCLANLKKVEKSCTLTQQENCLLYTSDAADE